MFYVGLFLHGKYMFFKQEISFFSFSPTFSSIDIACKGGLFCLDFENRYLKEAETDSSKKDHFLSDMYYCLHLPFLFFQLW
jgi:hypothetical protein